MADSKRLGLGLKWNDLAIGDRFHTAARTITEGDLNAFCNLTWLNEELFTNAHDRDELAIAGRVVPGALVYGFAEGLLLPFMQGTGLAFLQADLKVTAPTFVGDTMRVDVEVTELRATSKPDRGIVTTTNTILNQHGEAVLIYTPRRLLKR